MEYISIDFMQDIYKAKNKECALISPFEINVMQ
jgi:hypothetical protein